MTACRNRAATARIVGAILVLGLLPAACGDSDAGIGPVGPIDIGEDEGIPGSGDAVSEQRPVSGFTAVRLDGEGSVTVTRGATESLVVTTDDNLIGLIETNVTDGELRIATRDGTDIAPTDSVTYEVTATALDRVILGGAGEILADEITADTAEVRLIGAGLVRVDSVRAGRLAVEFSGVGEIELIGEADVQDAVVGGVGTYDGADLRSSVATVEALGMGVATVWVVDELDATASESGRIEYYGSPVVTSQTTGLGSIQPLGSR